MELNGRHRTALTIAALVAGLLVLISSWRVDETVSALKYWWAIAHATPSEYVVHHWATLYTWASALFAPFWLALSVGTFVLLRRRPIAALAAMSAYLIAAPISCTSAPYLYKESGGFFDLEELPFADAERAADLSHLIRVDERVKNWREGRGQFPLSPGALKDAVGALAYERSPYEKAVQALTSTWNLK
ncbi:MAG TPA: hypothetical protein VGR47_21045 [Terracidiphilus sp.]|nr:hypothetical protein [Terracidiphilus sp.]